MKIKHNIIELFHNGILSLDEEYNIIRNAIKIGRNNSIKFIEPRKIESIDKRGYKRFAIRTNKKTINVSSARLIWTLFFGQIPEGLTINHIDGNKINNNPFSNLEIITMKENIKHAIDMKLMDTRGEKNAQSKLKESQVKEIRKLYNRTTFNMRQISILCNVSEGCIENIINNKTWKHI